MMYHLQNGWTKEKMLEKVRAEFKGRSTKKRDGGGREICAYRGDGGKKCAMGIFIPDDLYNPNMDDSKDRFGKDMYASVASTILTHYPELVPHMPLDSHGMAALQRAHDDGINSADSLERILKFIEERVM